MLRKFVLILALLSISGIAAGSSKKPKILVALDNESLKESHSKFLGGLESAGYQIDIKTTKDSSIKLKEWDTWLYDGLIIFGAGNGLGKGVSVAAVSEFFDAGHDVLLAFDSKATTQVRDLATELGIELDAAANVAIDHGNYHPSLDSGSSHTAILSEAPKKLKAVFSSLTISPVAYRGVGLSISSSNELAFLALTGSLSAYSGVPGKVVTDIALAGPSLGLAALIQGRNNARTTVIGSIDIFSNEFLAAQPGNAPFASDILAWTFRQRGVLHASNLRHHVISRETTGGSYRIKDDVEFAIDLEECSDGRCKPYQADDVQVEFVMLHPYVRKTLTDNGNGTFSAQMKVPDVYGVFKWILDYRRPGYSWIQLSETVPVRPFRHTEYQRFIPQAYPYYASVMSMMAGFFALSFIFLYEKA